MLDPFIRDLPKTELHVHIEAAVRLQTLKDLARKYHFAKEYLEAVERFLARGYENIRDFFNLWKMVNSVILSAEDLERITYEYLEDLSEMNTIYAELNVNIISQLMKGLSAQQVADAMYRAEDAAEKDFGITARTIFSYSRDWNHEYGRWVVDMASKYHSKNVVGIDISGDEINIPNQEFVDVYRYAKEKGVKRVAHAGESAGPESIWCALNELHVVRIGHGLDIVKDENLVDYLEGGTIAIELCPTSNIALGFVSDVYSHPGRELIAEGVEVTINTDDPFEFQVSLEDEYNTVYRSWQLSRDNMINIAENGIRYALVEDEIKQDLYKEFESKLACAEQEDPLEIAEEISVALD